MKTIYELVTKDTNGHYQTIKCGIDELTDLITGYETNPRLRPELNNQPKLNGFIGPMWGGQGHEIDGRYIPEYVTTFIPEDAEKVNIIRYEAQSVYNDMCN